LRQNIPNSHVINIANNAVNAVFQGYFVYLGFYAAGMVLVVNRLKIAFETVFNQLQG
jgi:hypothetical protein